MNVVHISQADVGPSGYLITTPGVYCLIEDINWAPTTSGILGAPVAAITINLPTLPSGTPQGDVVLNLNGYFLGQAPGNAASYTVGIKVNGNLQNLIIQNGTVKNFGAAGIYVDPVIQLTLENLVVNNIGAVGSILVGLDNFVAGIALSGFNNLPTGNNLININNVSVYGVSPATPVAGYGLYIAVANDVNINNSSFSRNNSSLGPIAGINMTTSSAVRLNNVTTSDNTGLTFAYGMFFQFSSDIKCLNCNAHGNEISGIVLNAGAPYIVGGFVFNTCADYGLIGCTANENTTNVTSINPTGPVQHVSGFEVYGSADGNFENCVANANMSSQFTGASAYGFHLGTDHTKLTNCFAVNNGGWDTAWGFAVEAFRNDIIPAPAFQQDVVINQSVAEFNSVKSGTGSFGGGIMLRNVQNSVISNSVSSKNSNNGILLTEGPSGCVTINNLVQSNKLISNTVWGIQDNTADNDNGYVDNYAFNNPGDGSFTNYNDGVRDAGGGVPGTANAFIVPWAIPGLPPAVTGLDKISNLDITSSCSLPLP